MRLLLLRQEGDVARQLQVRAVGIVVQAKDVEVYTVGELVAAVVFALPRHTVVVGIVLVHHFTASGF